MSGFVEVMWKKGLYCSGGSGSAPLPDLDSWGGACRTLLPLETYSEEGDLAFSCGQDVTL